MSIDHRLERLIKALVDAKAELRKHPKRGYTRRAVELACFDQCDTGGEPAGEVTVLTCADLSVLIDALHCYPPFTR